tara:strand:+ start:41 stop:568 length:528 start_codon:yes stop_codon:yes gene_type:complete
MGGSDNPENIIELTIKQHAESHRTLWEEFNKREDWLAWQGLAKMIGKEEILKELLSLAGKKGGAAGKGVTGNRKNGAIANWNKNKDEILKTLRDNGKKYGHLGGIPGGKYIWITNDKEAKKVLKSETIPNGWRRGRLPLSDSTKEKIGMSCKGKAKASKLPIKNPSEFTKKEREA